MGSQIVNELCTFRCALASFIHSAFLGFVSNPSPFDRLHSTVEGQLRVTLPCLLICFEDVVFSSGAVTVHVILVIVGAGVCHYCSVVRTCADGEMLGLLHEILDLLT